MKTVKYTNPIIKGYAPDPSICTDGEGNYFIATSSFATYPGIPIYHSVDMVNWKLVSYAANNFDLGKTGTNGGLWAPTLRYINGMYYMIVLNKFGKDFFVTRTKDPLKGEWSEPAYIIKDDRGIEGPSLNEFGIDPDLFQDVDGKVYMNYTNEIMKDTGEYAAETTEDELRVTVFEAWEIDLETIYNETDIKDHLKEANKSIGTKFNKKKFLKCKNKFEIWRGFSDVFEEGSHIYRIGEYYYVLLAEGGTWVNHMATIARKPVVKGLQGDHDEWEVCPIWLNAPSIQKFKDKPKIQKEIVCDNVVSDPCLPHNPLVNNGGDTFITTTGHADMVEDKNGNWWLVCLGRRPNKKPDLARETYLAPVEFIDGWPLVNGGKIIEEYMEGPFVSEGTPYSTSFFDDFSMDALHPEWNYMRNPNLINYGFKASGLTLFTAKETIDDSENPAWLGIRQRDKEMTAETRLEFYPKKDNEVAGITVVNTTNFNKNKGIPAENAEFVIKKQGDKRLLVVDIKGEELAATELKEGYVCLKIICMDENYIFSYYQEGVQEVILYKGYSENIVGKPLFNGLYIGLYASGRGYDTRNEAVFSYFDCSPESRITTF